VSRRDNEKKRPRSPATVSAAARKLAAAVRADVRPALQADWRRKGGRWLALVPVTIGVFSLFLLMPRATEPSFIPLPRVDERVLDKAARADDALAEAAERTRLPSDVLAVGSGVRAVNALGRDADDRETISAKSTLDDAVRHVALRPGGEADLLALRALQTRRFLDEVARFETTGESSRELVELGGGFVDRMRSASWVVGRRVLLSDLQRRAAYHAMWNALTGVDGLRALAPSLDEQRALFALYLKHPHPPEARRAELEAQRRGADDRVACARAIAEEQRAAELWRAEKIQKLGAVDPAYPTSYALGVAYYRAGRYDLASNAFRAYVDAHPDGALALRARNHLKASLSAHGTL
jgi:hypothetical protein